MLTAGDEFGRTQHGNNNAYCQDNDLTWLDWQARDTNLQKHVAALARIRRQWPQLTWTALLTGDRRPGFSHADVEWLAPSGEALTHSDWESADGGTLAMVMAHPYESDGPRLAVLVNRLEEDIRFALPGRSGHRWYDLLRDSGAGHDLQCFARSIALLGERVCRHGKHDDAGTAVQALTDC
jgi:glycogen operon protein